jgi:hypothetical protein
VLRPLPPAWLLRPCPTEEEDGSGHACTTTSINTIVITSTSGFLFHTSWLLSAPPTTRLLPARTPATL